MLVTLYGVSLDGWAALNVAIQFVLPLLVGLVTSKETNRERQFLLLAGLTLLATVAAQALQAHDAGTVPNLVQIIVTAVINLAVSLLSHYGVWKPTNLSDLMLAVFTKAPTSPAPADPTPAGPAHAAQPVTVNITDSARHLAIVPPADGPATMAG